MNRVLKVLLSLSWLHMGSACPARWKRWCCRWLELSEMNPWQGGWAGNLDWKCGIGKGSIRKEGECFLRKREGKKTSCSTVHCIENVRSEEWGTSVFLILLFLGVYNLLGSVVKPQSSNSLRATTAHGMAAEHSVCFWEYHMWKPCFGVWHLGFE